MKDIIVQIDLVINWGKLRHDYTSRHLRITTLSNQQFFVKINKIKPVIYGSQFNNSKDHLIMIKEKCIKISFEDIYPFYLSTKKNSYTLNP